MRGSPANRAGLRDPLIPIVLGVSKFSNINNNPFSIYSFIKLINIKYEREKYNSSEKTKEPQ